MSCLISHGQTTVQDASLDFLSQTVLTAGDYLPHSWGEGMTLTELNLDDNYFGYTLELSNLMFKNFKILMQTSEQALRQEMLEGIVKTMDDASKEFVESVIAAKVGVQYVMWKEDYSENLTISFSNDVIKSAYDGRNTPPPPPAVEVKIEAPHQEEVFEEGEITIMDYQEEVVEEEVEEEAIPFQLVEVKPSFQGGDANQFSKWVNQRLVYPEDAKNNGIQGRVTLQFTIAKDGSVTKVKVIRGTHPALDAEAIRVVSMSPKWEPGRQRGRAVSVTYVFPVIFRFN